MERLGLYLWKNTCEVANCQVVNHVVRTKIFIRRTRTQMKAYDITITEKYRQCTPTVTVHK